MTPRPQNWRQAQADAEHARERLERERRQAELDQEPDADGLYPDDIAF